jgi:glycosyltransferase involved in cell wall biosynthesis
LINNINEHKTYSYRELVGLNEPHPFSKGTNVVSINISDIKPTISVIVPVYNKSKIIEEILNGICTSIKSIFEIIIIDDCSSDDSLTKIMNFCKNQDLQYIILRNGAPLFETACDNIGFTISRGDFLLEIQSDIFIKDFGFDLRLIKAAIQPGISSVSGRCVHSWYELFNKKAKFIKFIISPFFLIKSYFIKTGIGLMGADIFDKSISLNIDPESMYIGDTNNRGPWMITAKNFKILGPLDSDNFFLGGDDHDFNFKAKKKGMVASYVPVNLHSNHGDGSTRQIRAGQNKDIYNYLLHNKNGYKSLQFKLLLEHFTFPSSILKKNRLK